MTPDQADRHGRAEDERARAAREKRVKDRATKDAEDLARARARVCLASDTEVRDPGEDGCYW